MNDLRMNKPAGESALSQVIWQAIVLLGVLVAGSLHFSSL